MTRTVRSAFSIALVLALAAPLLAAEKAERVNLNTASRDELVALPRIGPALAERIVAYRQQSGGFKRIEDLLNVQGVGPKTFELIKDRLTVGDPERGSRAEKAEKADR